jgi:hypothetical protein
MLVSIKYEMQFNYMKYTFEIFDTSFLNASENFLKIEYLRFIRQSIKEIIHSIK